MEVKVCVGSACYVKGSHEVISQIEKLIETYHLGQSVVLKAAFCLGHCTEAVSVEVEGTVYSVEKDEVNQFFKEHVLGRVRTCK
ncbi:MAG: (2Fe-2S) ferredoxin domain-containing protein [Cellulosilyticaceae bacterium]